ncbi:hypothetical protein C0992_000392, partial [Termitomyces sp. T32_za158]
KINEFINTASYPDSDAPRKVSIPNISSESEVKAQLEEVNTQDKDLDTPSVNELQYPPATPSTPPPQTATQIEVSPAPHRVD